MYMCVYVYLKATHTHEYIPGSFLCDFQEDCCYYWKLIQTSSNLHCPLKLQGKTTENTSINEPTKTKKEKNHKGKQQLDDEDFKMANIHMDWKHGLHLSY